MYTMSTPSPAVFSRLSTYASVRSEMVRMRYSAYSRRMAKSIIRSSMPRTNVAMKYAPQVNVPMIARSACASACAGQCVNVSASGPGQG